MSALRVNSGTAAKQNAPGAAFNGILFSLGAMKPEAGKPEASALPLHLFINWLFTKNA
jgi:hypothetical protein